MDRELLLYLTSVYYSIIHSCGSAVHWFDPVLQYTYLDVQASAAVKLQFLLESNIHLRNLSVIMKEQLHGVCFFVMSFSKLTTIKEKKATLRQYAIQ